MYGSIHTHFESLYDTGNDLKDMLKEFVSVGAKKVAVTEHGDFTSFEELKDIAKTMKDEKGNRLIDVIPGVEGYLNTTKDDSLLSTGEEDRDHFILIAKDKEGYKYLSNIITKSNIDHDVKDRPVITWENLRDNIREPGHLFCTTACVAGPLGKIFVDDEKEYERQKEKYLSRIPFTEDEQADIIRINETYLAMTDAEKKALSPSEKEAYKANRKKYNVIRRNMDKIAALPVPDTEKSEEDVLLDKLDRARSVYEKLCGIFGKDMVYLEIQNHGIDKEADAYPGIINFAVNEGIEDHLIASNDIHIGKVHPEEKDFLRRNVAGFQRFKNFTPSEDWEKELYIKDDGELQNALRSLPHPNMGKYAPIAVNNIRNLLSQCETDYIYEKDKNHYPKFCDDENELFDKLIEEGKALKFPSGFPDERYEERLSHEMDVIKSMGYAGYHLIVQDYLDYGRNVGKLPKEAIPFAPDDLQKVKDAVEKVDAFETLVREGLTYSDDTDRAYQDMPAFIKDHISENELTRQIKTGEFSTAAMSIGPGRGSGVGSLCCYLLGITDLDPIKYDLLFERFLNPERVSMPDIDADFRTDIREKCIRYCATRYGDGKTSKIITKSYGDIKGNLRLAARYIGSRDFLTDTDPKERSMNEAQMKVSFMKRYLDMGDSLAKRVDEKTGEFPEDIAEGLRGKEKEIYDVAMVIEGIYTGFGEHAAGNIISADKISDIIPLKWNAKNENYSTQCTMNDAEAKGLLKMDFLGLDNLDILTEIIRLTGDDIISDYSKRDELLSDKATIEHIFDTGLTQGVFQFESDGMKKMLCDFHPDSFEDIILLVAAYRPGPMQYLPEIIARKKYETDPVHNKEPERTIKVNSPVLDKILSPTYGCMIYQEQVMKVCTDLAGYSLGQADIVRKAMSKKHLDEIERERDSFIHGDEKRGIEGCIKKCNLTEEEANGLFDQMLDFASYAFNKSHATAYSLISFFTAYYKDRYPAIFYSVALNHIKALDELSPFRAEMGRFHVSLNPPKPGVSGKDFTADKNDIYFGFSSIKGLSDIHIKPAETLDGLILKNPSVSAKTFLTLAKAGVLDSYGDRKAIASYMDLYHDKVLKKADAKIRYDALMAEENPDKRKLSGVTRTLSNLEDLPTFEEFTISHQDEIKDFDLITEQYKLLGTVFMEKKVEDDLKDSPAFSELSEGKQDTKEVKVLCLGTEKKEYKSKWNNDPYFGVLLMDKNYEIRRYFLPHPIDPGFYIGPMTKNPFSTNKTKKAGEMVLHAYTPDERTSICIKWSGSNMERQGQQTRLERLKAGHGDRPRYCTIYSGNRNGRFKIGNLDKDEMKEYVKDEIENHNAEFLDGDEFLTLD